MPSPLISISQARSISIISNKLYLFLIGSYKEIEKKNYVNYQKINQILRYILTSKKIKQRKTKNPSQGIWRGVLRIP
jgi:hypothetical protein